MGLHLALQIAFFVLLLRESGVGASGCCKRISPCAAKTGGQRFDLKRYIARAIIPRRTLATTSLQQGGRAATNDEQQDIASSRETGLSRPNTQNAQGPGFSLHIYPRQSPSKQSRQNVGSESQGSEGANSPAHTNFYSRGNGGSTQGSQQESFTVRNLDLVQSEGSDLRTGSTRSQRTSPVQTGQNQMLFSQKVDSSAQDVGSQSRRSKEARSQEFTAFSSPGSGGRTPESQQKSFSARNQDFAQDEASAERTGSTWSQRTGPVQAGQNEMLFSEKVGSSAQDVGSQSRRSKEARSQEFTAFSSPGSGGRTLESQQKSFSARNQDFAQDEASAQQTGSTWSRQTSPVQTGQNQMLFSEKVHSSAQDVGSQSRRSKEARSQEFTAFSSPGSGGRTLQSQQKSFSARNQDFAQDEASAQQTGSTWSRRTSPVQTGQNQMLFSEKVDSSAQDVGSQSRRSKEAKSQEYAAFYSPGAGGNTQGSQQQTFLARNLDLAENEASVKRASHRGLSERVLYKQLNNKK